MTGSVKQELVKRLGLADLQLPPNKELGDAFLGAANNELDADAFRTELLQYGKRIEGNEVAGEMIYAAALSGDPEILRSAFKSAQKVDFNDHELSKKIYVGAAISGSEKCLELAFTKITASGNPKFTAEIFGSAFQAAVTMSEGDFDSKLVKLVESQASSVNKNNSSAGLDTYHDKAQKLARAMAKKM